MTQWDDEQYFNARLIVTMGREMGMNSNEILSGLMAAMQESSLRNISYGDRDSIGLFQQRPSQGWGTYKQIMDPMYATKKYFTTLKGVKDRGAMSPTLMAQAVQRSAYPNAYAKWQQDAQALIAAKKQINEIPFPLNSPRLPIEQRGTDFPTGGISLDAVGSDGTASPSGVSLDAPLGVGVETPGGVGTTPVSNPSDPNFEKLQELLGQMNQNQDSTGTTGYDENFYKGPVSPMRQKIIDIAKSALGTPYVWGGESYDEGGFDCSGLISWAMQRAGIQTGARFTTYNMVSWKGATQANDSQLRPGDWVMLHPEGGSRGGPGAWGHVAFWLGNGYILEAPRTGLNVRIRKLNKGEVHQGYHLKLAGD